MYCNALDNMLGGRLFYNKGVHAIIQAYYPVSSWFPSLQYLKSSDVHVASVPPQIGLRGE